MSPGRQRALLWVVGLLVVGGLLGLQRHESQTTSRKIEQAGHKADLKIIETGRKSIRSGCNFDNQRAHAIRKIIRRGIANQRKLYHAGGFTREQYLHNRAEGKRAIREIVIRDCKRAAHVLDSG